MSSRTNIDYDNILYRFIQNPDNNHIQFKYSDYSIAQLLEYKHVNDIRKLIKKRLITSVYYIGSLGKIYLSYDGLERIFNYSNKRRAYIYRKIIKKISKINDLKKKHDILESEYEILESEYENLRSKYFDLKFRSKSINNNNRSVIYI